jgi:hypothetical protein
MTKTSRKPRLPSTFQCPPETTDPVESTLMAMICKEIVIRVDAATVRDAVRDIGALHTRLVPGFVTNTQLESGARLVTFGNGQVVRELIVDIDDYERRLAWAIVDSPLQHYSASAQIFGNDPHSCRFVWIANVLPNEVAETVAAMIDKGLGAAKANLERATWTAEPSITSELTETAQNLVWQGKRRIADKP